MSQPGAAAAGKWLCPGCDASVSLDATAHEPVCPSCGTRLVQLDRRDDDDLVGQIIDGRFEIRAFLGEGGMGTVYRAWQRSIGREVAIKLIDKRHGRDEMAVRRFLREARLASQLSQPNTVSVFDVGQAKDGRLFLAMELIRGRTLDKVVEQEGAFSQARAARVGVQLCDALEAAARLQIVHRDLKPANVIVLDDPPGRDLIKVLDFGLAKSLVGDESEATQSGLIVGTPRYMSPEVLMGSAQTASSDLYAVGVILGELMAGAVMWQATAFPVLLANKVDGSEITRGLPQPMRGIVEKLIAAEPERRHASAVALREALLPVIELRGETPAPKPSVPTVAFSAVTSTPTHDKTLALTPTPAPSLQLADVKPRAIPVATPAPLGSGTALPSSVTSTRRPPWAVILGLAVAALGVVAFLAMRGGDDDDDDDDDARDEAQAPARGDDPPIATPVGEPDPPDPAPAVTPDASPAVELGVGPVEVAPLGGLDPKKIVKKKKPRGSGSAAGTGTAEDPPTKGKPDLPF